MRMLLSKSMFTTAFKASVIGIRRHRHAGGNAPTTPSTRPASSPPPAPGRRPRGRTRPSKTARPARRAATSADAPPRAAPRPPWPARDSCTRLSTIAAAGVAHRLQRAQLAHARRERGVHRVQPAEQPAQRDQPAVAQTIARIGRKNAEQLRVVVRLAHRDQLQVEPLLGERVDVVELGRRRRASARRTRGCRAWRRSAGRAAGTRPRPPSRCPAPRTRRRSSTAACRTRASARPPAARPARPSACAPAARRSSRRAPAPARGPRRRAPARGRGTPPASRRGAAPCSGRAVRGSCAQLGHQVHLRRDVRARPAGVLMPGDAARARAPATAGSISLRSKLSSLPAPSRITFRSPPLTSQAPLHPAHERPRRQHEQHDQRAAARRSAPAASASGRGCGRRIPRGADACVIRPFCRSRGHTARNDAVISRRDACHAGTSPATTPSSADDQQPDQQRRPRRPSIWMLKPFVDRL